MNACNNILTFTLHCNSNVTILNSQVWEHWYNGNTAELLDPAVPPSREEADQELLDRLNRNIQIGLLCVQEKPELRPDISEVVEMLSGRGELQRRPERPTLRTGDGETSGSSSHTNYHTGLALPV